eukprot:snap_masked-scaffold_108-processed-gene-0.2-mRNA-1 protein AED:1.00 eAED:1.00 QI:0/0/0/0/1/1/2/0/84
MSNYPNELLDKNQRIPKIEVEAIISYLHLRMFEGRLKQNGEKKRNFCKGNVIGKGSNLKVSYLQLHWYLGEISEMEFEVPREMK